MGEIKNNKRGNNSRLTQFLFLEEVFRKKLFCIVDRCPDDGGNS